MESCVRGFHGYPPPVRCLVVKELEDGNIMDP